MSHELQILPSQTNGSSIPLPMPRVAINIRPATMDDLPFIDQLQKKHTKQVGFMPTKQFEGKIKAGHVLIAEERVTADYADNADKKELDLHSSAPSALSAVKSVGYCIGNDQYFKRDDVGIIYQINIAEGKRRALVGATLLKAQFDRSAYGCRLYCCWCAQDIEANRFWESMGFVPLAFRAGSAVKSRVHIFWQKRIRAGDNETPWWFPAKTDAGALREDRLVLPIPPGKHWSEEMPRILPGILPVEPATPALEDQRAAGKARREMSAPSASGPVKHGPRQYGAPPTVQAVAEKVIEKPKPQKKPKKKADPMHIAAARELRDRWLEKVNGDASVLGSSGKYQISKQFSAPSVEAIATIRALPGSTSSPQAGSTGSPQEIAA